MQDNLPFLVSCKTLKPEFIRFKKINITSENFTLGRALTNSVAIPSLFISRSHCYIYKQKNDWLIEDYSACGIEINGDRLGKGNVRTLQSTDVVTLEPSQEFVYKFMWNNDCPVEIKRIKLEHPENLCLNDVKIKFEESQNCEIQHMEDKIQKQKQLQETNKLLQQQLYVEMQRELAKLECEFATQIENLKGEKNEVEKQKVLLLEERDAHISTLKNEMDRKINDLMKQIKKQNEAESELLIENNSLKEKLLKEREEFLSELNRETSSKQDMLQKLEAKMKEQEELRLKEKNALEDMLRKETEQLKLAKEKELRELEDQKQQREDELMQELDEIKENLTKQIKATNEQKLKAEELLNHQKDEMKKISDADRIKMEQLVNEREEIRKRLEAAEEDAKTSVEQLKMRVQEREVELAMLAAERIQKQTDQSTEVICSLQNQLEKVKNQLESVEGEKQKLLENFAVTDSLDADTSKNKTLTEVGEIMENELQCSICAELFVSATTLNCSHTFCKYCIATWKKKKKDCPICRAPITSECRSLVLDSFIDKMVQNLTNELKKKRQDMLKSREELECNIQQTKEERGRRRSSEENWSENESSASQEDQDLETDSEFNYEDFYDAPEYRNYGLASYSGLSSYDEPPTNAGTQIAPQPQGETPIQVILLEDDGSISLVTQDLTTAATDRATPPVLEDIGPSTVLLDDSTR